MTCFIVLEALDGVGKTTLARNLAEQYSFAAMSTPGVELKPIRESILDGLGENQTARALFYCATVAAEGKKARGVADSGQAVVMDRYIASTIAYAQARGVTADLDALIPAMEKPDLCILLTLDEEERIKRMQSREEFTEEDSETLDSSFRETVLAELKRQSDVIVDLTGYDESNAVDRILQAIFDAGIDLNPEFVYEKCQENKGKS